MGNEIFIIAEHRDGKIKKNSLELLSLGKKLCSKCNAKLSSIILGTNDSNLFGTLSQYGAEKIFYCEDEVLKSYSTEGYSSAIANLVKEQNPQILLGGATAQGKDLLPRVAAKLEVGLASDCVDIDVDENGNLLAQRPIYAGKALINVSFTKKPQMAALRPNVFEVSPPDNSQKAEIVKFESKVNSSDLRAVIKELVKSASEKLDLTEAKIIISGGRGIGSKENFKILEDLVQVFGEGTVVGASRAAVDAGFAPHDIQVGQTGKVVNPELYIACGISGSIQHLAGMVTSKYIVAINKDPEAPIFQKADYGIVGDLFKVVPILTEELKKLKASQI